MFGVTKDQFYESRDVDWAFSLSVGKGDDILYKIWTSVARLKENIDLKKPRGYKRMRWFRKSEVLDKISYWKGYSRAFRRIFPNDTFWECLDTEKHKKQV